MLIEHSPRVRLDSVAPGDVVRWLETVWLVAKPKACTTLEMLAPEGCVLLVRVEDGMSMFADPWEICQRYEHAVYRL